MSLPSKLTKRGMRSLFGDRGVDMARHLRDMTFFHWYLKSGFGVWRAEGKKQLMEPLRFRNGMIWYHAERDEPILLFREIYIAQMYAFDDAPMNAHILDIGANIGAFTMVWAHRRSDLTFHAYEPNPAAHATLQKNVEINGLSDRVKVHSDAIGRARGELDLWVDVPTTQATAYGDAPYPGARKRRVPMITLDDAWERMGRAPIWMLKIDTEGAEVDILEGASSVLLDNVANACVEWHNNVVPDAFVRCGKRLAAAGFKYRTRNDPWDVGLFYASRA